MGRSFLFECPRCGYQAKVSGGPDAGVTLRVQTILCRDCKALYDAVLRFKVPDRPGAGARSKSGFAGTSRQQSPARRPPTFETAVGRLFLTANNHFRWVPFKLRCPVSRAHRIRPWNEPDQCPKCGAFLEKNALPFRIWE